MTAIHASDIAEETSLQAVQGPYFFFSLSYPGVEFQSCPGYAYLAQQLTNVTVDMHRDVAI